MDRIFNYHIKLTPMPEKDPTTYSMITYLWVIGLSTIGGFVSFMRKVREGNAKFINITELIGEIVTAGFAGVLTFWLCEAADMAPLVSAAMVGVSGHMGSRVIMQLEVWLSKKLPESNS